MPRVRPHTRRNGTRGRGRARVRPIGGSRIRRPSTRSPRRLVTRRFSARGSDNRAAAWLLLGVIAVAALALITQFVQRHPYWSALIALIVFSGVAMTRRMIRQERNRRTAQVGQPTRPGRAERRSYRLPLEDGRRGLGGESRDQRP